MNFMIKVILFDCDGPIIRREKYFSARLMDLGIELDAKKIHDFFGKEFLLCETGKADLKEELAGRISAWGWDKSLEELLDFWFSGEADADKRMLEYIQVLRQKGIACYLSTNNEKYRVRYLWSMVGLSEFLNGTLASFELGFLKPQVEFWQEAHKRIPKVRKAEVLVIDDTPSVIASAKAFGFNAQLHKDFNSTKYIIYTYLNTV